jgi:hypothetical protein
LKKKKEGKKYYSNKYIFFCEEVYKQSPPLLVFVNIRLVTRATPLAGPICFNVHNGCLGGNSLFKEARKTLGLGH